MRHGVRAERLPQLLVPALADQVQVEPGERGQQPVRVRGLVVGALVGDQETVLVRGRGQVDEAREEAVAVVVQQGPEAVRHDRDRAGVRAQRPERRARGRGVRAQRGVRVVVGAGEEAVAVGGGGGGRGGGDGCRRCGAGGVVRHGVASWLGVDMGCCGVASPGRGRGMPEASVARRSIAERGIESQSGR